MELVDERLVRLDGLPLSLDFVDCYDYELMNESIAKLYYLS